MNDLPRTFAALADDTRFAIVERLMTDGELPAGALVAEFDISAPAISRHLKVLRMAGIVMQRAEGTHRYYSVRADAIRAISAWALERRAFWEGSLDRMDSLLALDPEGEETRER